MHRMWGELRRCEPAPHPPREGPRHVSGCWGGVERGRRPSSCRAVRARVRRALRSAFRAVFSPCGCRLCVRRPQRALTIFQIDPQQSNTQRALWQSGGGTHDTGPTPAEHSAVDSGPPRRAAAPPQLAARRRRQLGSRSVMLMHGYGIGTASDMCYATCFISCLLNRLLSSLSFLKGDRGPSF